MGVQKITVDGKEQMIIREEVTPFLQIERKVKEVLFEDKEIHESELVEDEGPLGKCLFMNGYIQSAEADSHIYHESLVQPALALVQGTVGRKPKRVLIGGGGELVTAYECLKHKSVEQVDMIDIDGRVLDMAKKQLQAFHFDSWKDERLNLVVDDVHKFVTDFIAKKDDKTELYDVVIMDICDPTEGYGPARLYTQEFYEMCKQCMTPNGVFVTQSTALQQTNYMTAARIRKTAQEVFGNAYSYRSFVPSFVECWGFTIAGANLSVEGNVDVKTGEILNMMGDTAANIDDLLEKSDVPCRYYDAETHMGMFLGLGKDLRAALLDEKVEVATEANLVRFLNAEDEYGA